MDAGTARRLVRLTSDAERELTRAYATGLLSARGRLRVLRVARTIADLGHRDTVGRADLLTALGLRQRATSEAAIAL